MDETHRPAARRSALLLPPLAIACGLAACNLRRDERPGMAIDEPWSGARVRELAHAFAEPPQGLTAYRWDAGPRVPAAFGSPPASLSHGEAGLSAETDLYLPLNEGAAGRLADRSERPWRVELQGGAWTDGRFGPGLELGPGARLALQRDAPIDGAPATIELWIRPGARRRGGALLAAPGSFRLAALEDGRLRLTFEGARGTVTSRDALERDAWNRVGIVLDGPELRSARLVVNDTAAWWLRPAGVEPRPWSALVLAGPAAGDPYVIDDLRVELRGANSAECMERWANAIAPGPHTLSLELGAEERTLEVWSGVLETPELASRADWESGRLEHFVAGDDGLRWVPGHWERDPAPSPPLARTTHPVVYVGDHRAFMYGGETKDSHAGPMVNTDDTWIYRIDERAWRRVARSPAPPPRCHQHAAYSPDHDLVLIAGGWRNDALGPKVYADTWVYHVEEERWEERTPESFQPEGLNDSSIVYHARRRLFLTFPARSVHAYDPESNRWIVHRRAAVVDASGAETELPRGGSRIAGYDPSTGLVLLFGMEFRTGKGDGLAYDNPTILYDFDANRFTVRRPEPSPAERTRGALAWDSKRGRFVLFGGVRDQYSRRFDDLWTYDVAEDAWTRHEASNAPQRRGGYYGMAYDPELDVFVVLAGRHAVTRFLNEAWRLRLDPAAEAVGTWVFDRAAFPERSTLWADLAVAEGGKGSLRFAASRDGTTWSEWSDDAATVVDAGARFVKVEVRATTPPGAAPARVRGLGFSSRARPEGRTSWSVAPYAGSGAAR